MKIEELQNIVDNKKEAIVDGFTITVQQAEILVMAYNLLNKNELKEMFLTISPFDLITFCSQLACFTEQTRNHPFGPMFKFQYNCR